MTQKQFNVAAGSVFLLIAFLHLLRLIFHWEAVIEDYPIPMWISAAAFVVASYLAWQGLRPRSQ